MSSDLIKELRERTGAGMLDCKKALDECGNDLQKASEYLRKKGILKAEKKSGRATSQGKVHSYIHGEGKIGVLVEVNCETDFVAKTDEFNNLIHEIALHIAATNPKYLNSEQVPQTDIDKEKSVLKAQAENEGKKGPVVDKIVEGRVQKFFQQNCLLQQAYIKDPDKTVESLLKETIGRIGENITIRRFSRFQLGEITES